MFEKSKWIWPNTEQKQNDWAKFRVKINGSSRLEKAVASIAADTKYYAYINGQLVVFEGSLNRKANVGDGYYDEIDLAPYLQEGENELLLLVWHWGNGGRNNNRVPTGGLLFSCDALELYSDETWECAELPESFAPEGEQPQYLYGGFNIGFDARKSGQENWHSACVLGTYPEKIFGILSLRPIPLIRFEPITEAKWEQRGDTYVVKLPYAMQYTPWLHVKAAGGESIDIRSDRYLVPGGPGDHHHSYRGHRTEYICKAGEQTFESLNWIFGEEVIFRIPKGVEILSLGYRESGYDTEVKEFHCENKRLEKLLQKCARTLKCCMRDNFMDCPDRERGFWIGDVSVQAPQVFYALDEKAVLLLRKSIMDFINLRRGDVLCGLVPGENIGETISQSLTAISEVGLIAEYYHHTGDKEILQLAFEPMVRYLQLWEMGEDGLIIGRDAEGAWRWFDHSYNIDEDVIENAWYVSALKFTLFVAKEIDEHQHDAQLEERLHSIEQNFDKKFYNGKYYASKDFVDDRANAMAVIAGLADESKYIGIRDVLLTVFNSTTYMENYVLLALCKMGYVEDAYRRMMGRYAPLIDNDDTTLQEDFYILGTRNHAWTGAPLTIYARYLCKDREKNN